jgi:hypothetical protein
MSNQTDYHQMLDAIMAIDEKDVKKPNMPVALFAQEGDDLHSWCQADRQVLETKGLDWNLVEELPVYLGALRETQSRWNTERNAQQEAVSVWREKAAKAYSLRDALLRDFRYAFRNDPEILNPVNTITGSRSHAGLIQKLSDLSVLGKRHPELLAAIKFDSGRLDQASALTTELAALLATVNGYRKRQNAYKMLRDKAYTLCKNRIDMIRTCGKFALWNNPERIKGYASKYRREQFKHYKKLSEPHEKEQ